MTLHHLMLESGGAVELTGGQQGHREQVDGTVIPAVQREGAGVLLGKDVADVVVDFGNSREVSGCRRSIGAQRRRRQSRVKAAGIAGSTLARRGTRRPVDLWIMASQPGETEDCGDLQQGCGNIYTHMLR